MDRIVRFIVTIVIVGSTLITTYHKVNEYRKFVIQENKRLGNFSSLQESVSSALTGTSGDYAVAVKALSADKSYYLNADKVFEVGSLYKLWVMATVMKKIETGEIHGDQVLSNDVAYLNGIFGINPEWAELKQGKVTLTVDSAVEQMITISHNYATYLLVENIGSSEVKKFISERGFNNSSLDGEPKSNSYDVVEFFEQLYRGELANEENTKRMLNLLKKQTLNNKLPKYLPADVSVAHKTGEIYYFSHDAGIVFSNSGDYIIVVMSESDFPSLAADRIANISKNVFRYFNPVN